MESRPTAKGAETTKREVEIRRTDINSHFIDRHGDVATYRNKGILVHQIVLHQLQSVAKEVDKSRRRRKKESNRTFGEKEIESDYYALQKHRQRTLTKIINSGYIYLPIRLRSISTLSLLSGLFSIFPSSDLALTNNTLSVGIKQRKATIPAKSIRGEMFIVFIFVVITIFILFYTNMKGPCLCLCLYLWEEDGGFIHSENVKEFFRVVAYIFRRDTDG
jgi:hypothetical protein